MYAALSVLKVLLVSMRNNLGGREWVAIEVVGDSAKCFLVWCDVCRVVGRLYTGMRGVFCVYVF